MKQFITAVIVILIQSVGIAQLDLNQIMSGNTFIGPQPHDVRWSPDSKTIYFRWSHHNEIAAPYYSYSLETKITKKLNANEIKTLPVNGFFTDKFNTHFYFVKDYYLYKWTAKGNKLIYSNYSPFSVHQICTNGNIIIQQNINFYLLNIADLSFTQISNFNSGYAPKKNEQTDFLSKQQIELFEIVRTENKRGQELKQFKDSTTISKKTALYLNKNELSNVKFSSDFIYVTYSIDIYPENTNTHIEEYVNSSGYSESITARPKVGSEDAKHELFLYNEIKDSLYKIDISNLTGIYNRPIFLKEYEGDDFKLKSANPKNVIYHNHGFNESNTICLIEIKSYDGKDRWITALNCETGKLNEIDYQHSDEWIGGPGISGWKFEAGNCGWLTNTDLFFQSEKTGYSHLYKATLNQVGQKNSIAEMTSGKFEIHEAIYNYTEKCFYISANKLHPGNREFYKLDINHNLIPIATTYGNHNVFVSPDGKQIADLYSFKNKPWELYLGLNKSNTALMQLTNSTSADFNKYTWREPDVISFKAKDKTDIYARLYLPEESIKNNAAIIFVHGAGYLQNAHNWWSSYYREYMFHNFLADQGYTILDIDYRASEGYGRDFRTGIYRHMGGLDLGDQLDGRKFLIDSLNIDSTRIGIYGGSYGGFITLMALLTEPGKFKCGAALRSVTDWAHYNHEYTSNILNTPELDPIAFKRSSPIYFAEGLQDQLLILHGIEDDNVQYQDVVRLTQRFIELKKTSWDIIGYPIEPHGFIETTSWIDEYRRIFQLFEKNLK